MKKIAIFILSGFIICATFKPAVVKLARTPSSYKSNALLTDYRDAYAGNYFCNRSHQLVNADHSGLITYSDTLTITIVKDALDSILDMTCGLYAFKVKLKSSILYAYPGGRPWGGRFFASDSIFFTSMITRSPNIFSYRCKKK